MLRLLVDHKEYGKASSIKGLVALCATLPKPKNIDEKPQVYALTSDHLAYVPVWSFGKIIDFT